MGKHTEGVEESFAQLWERHQRVVYQGCLSWTRGRRDDAEEAFGRVALHALQKYRRAFRDADHARAWLLTVARNVCIDMYRQRTRLREISLEGTLEPFRFAERAESDPETDLLARESGLRFRAAMSVLPPLLRTPATLYVDAEMPYGDIARHLGISEVAVRKRMQQAREVLRDVIAGSGPALPKPHAAEVAGDPNEPEWTLTCTVVRTRGGVERDANLLLARRASRRRAGRLTKVETYIEAHPAGWRKRLELARMLAAAGNFDSALPHYRFAIQRQPFPLAPWLELGSILEILDEIGEAVELYCAGSRDAGRSADRMHLRARAEARRGNAEGARELFVAACAANERDPAHLRALAEHCLASAEPLDAVRALVRCLELAPADPLAPVLLHDALLMAGRPHAARQAVEEAAVRGNANAAVLERLIALRALAGEVSGAAGRETATMLRTLRRLAPGRAGTHYAAALVAVANGACEDAEETLSLYTRKHPRHGAAWRMLADVRLRCGRGGAALPPALTATELEPRSRDAWVVLCEAARHGADAGMPAEKAREIVAGVAEGWPNDALLLSAAARLAAATGDHTRAAALRTRARAVGS